MTMTNRCSLREVVGRIVLQTELPMPTGISLFNEGSGVSLTFENVASAEAWGRFLGGEVSPSYADGGKRYANVGNMEWLGWAVLVHGSDSVQDGGALSAETAAALAELTGEPADQGVSVTKK